MSARSRSYRRVGTFALLKISTSSELCTSKCDAVSTFVSSLLWIKLDYGISAQILGSADDDDDDLVTIYEFIEPTFTTLLWHRFHCRVHDSTVPCSSSGPQATFAELVSKNNVTPTITG